MSYPSALSPDAAVDAAASVLGGQRFRLRRPAAGDAGHWVSAEKGYLREVGNLLFHLSLLGVLLSIALGGLFGYKADKLLVEGQTFSDTTSALDEFHPGRLVSGSDLAPFSLTLNKFTASYIDSGQSIGQPATFDADVTYTASPGGTARNYHIQVNHPLSVDSLKVYLIGHGYAPEFKVTGANGTGGVRGGDPVHPGQHEHVPLRRGRQGARRLARLHGRVRADRVLGDGTLESIFPAADNPAVSLIGYSGNLGMNSGAPQSVYQLDTTGMTKISGSPHLLAPGPDVEAAGRQGIDHLRRRQAVGDRWRSPTTPGRCPRSSAACWRSPGCCCRSSCGGAGCSSGPCPRRPVPGPSSRSAA